MLFWFGLWVSQTQSYSIGWHKIARGWSASSHGQYTVSGIPPGRDQPDAGGPMTAPTSDVGVTGGFGALLSMVQTPGAPTLNVSHTGNTVKVYWQVATGWTLQGNSNLSTTNRVAPAETINHDGINNYILVNPPVGNEFYRLFKP